MAEISSSTRIGEQRERRAGELDQGARGAGPGHLGGRGCQRIFGVRLDQPLARHDLREHDLRRAARRGVHRADDEADQSTANRIDSQPSHHASGTVATVTAIDNLADARRPAACAPIEPDSGRQGEQDERHHLHGRQHAHLSGRGMQQHRRRQRQREQRHLAAERGDQNRGPQPPVRGVAQQIGRSERKATQPLEC